MKLEVDGRRKEGREGRLCFIFMSKSVAKERDYPPTSVHGKIEKNL